MEPDTPRCAACGAPLDDHTDALAWCEENGQPVAIPPALAGLL